MKGEGSIGIFDSGYGGLTVLREIIRQLPDYHYIYLGDNARAPYGTRSFDVVYRYTLQCVEQLFGLGCPLVILACNTASAKALRTIQQNDLPRLNPDGRVLGVIRPSVETFGTLSNTHHIGILATRGTVVSQSYILETEKLYGADSFVVTQLACPMWVSLVENGELTGAGAEYFVKKYIDELLSADAQIDTILLGCTHFPLLRSLIMKYCPSHIRVVEQGHIVAEKLEDYLFRHRDMSESLSRRSGVEYYTTEYPDAFEAMASFFMDEKGVNVRQIIF